MTKANALLKIMSTDFEVEPEAAKRAYDKLVSAANDLGALVICSNDAEEYPFGWNGEVIRIDSPSLPAYDLAHELGHLLVCAPQRRHLPEFGLGGGFSTIGGDARQVVTDEVGDREEDYACMLAGLLLEWAGLPNLHESELVQFVMIDPDTGKASWNKQWGAHKRVPYRITKLIKWGIIDKDLSLTFKARTEEAD